MNTNINLNINMPTFGDFDVIKEKNEQTTINFSLNKGLNVKKQGSTIQADLQCGIIKSEYRKIEYGKKQNKKIIKKHLQ